MLSKQRNMFIIRGGKEEKDTTLLAASNMGADFVSGVQSVLEGILKWFTDVFATIGDIIYTPGTGETAGSLTAIGWVLAIVVGLSVVGFGIRFVMKLVSKIKAKD
jgi:uncharacterized protein (UPF0264 family)